MRSINFPDTLRDKKGDLQKATTSRTLKTRITDNFHDDYYHYNAKHTVYTTPKTISKTTHTTSSTILSTTSTMNTTIKTSRTSWWRMQLKLLRIYVNNTRTRRIQCIYANNQSAIGDNNDIIVKEGSMDCNNDDI